MALRGFTKEGSLYICTAVHLYLRAKRLTHLYHWYRGWLLGGSSPPPPVTLAIVSPWAQSLLAAVWEAPLSSSSSSAPHMHRHQQLAPIPPLGPADVETLTRRGLLLGRLLLLFSGVPGVAAAVLKQVHRRAE